MADLSVYATALGYPAQAIMEELAEKIHKKTGAGVTFVGNRLTIRWGKPMKEVHMVVLEIDDGTPEPVDPDERSPK